MKKYRIIAIVLALCLMSVFSISVLAAENNDSDLGSAYAVVTDPGAIITPRSATGSFSGTLTGEYVNYDMVLQGDYRYWRMTITNSGNYDINVNVNGKVYTVAKGDTGDIWSTNK